MEDEVSRVPDSVVKVLYNLLGSSAAKISFFFGAILIFLAWVLDQWGAKYLMIREVYGYQMGTWFFSLGLSFVFLAMVLIVRDWMSWRRKVSFYRDKYPISDLDKKFYLISFRGTVFLFGKRTKKRQWVKSWLTASDLGFHGYITYVDQTFSQRLRSESTVRTDSGEKFNIAKFTLGEGIHTRGTPGS